MILLLIAGFLGVGALDGGFVFDDVSILLSMPNGAGGSWAHPGSWLTSRLMTFETYRFDFASGNNPLHYHVTSLIIHLFAIAFLYLVLLKIVPAAAFWGALAFAVHPIFTEGVQYITARSSMLSAMWIWAALTAALWIKRPWLKWTLIALSAWAAIMAKEEGLLAIPVLLLVLAILNGKPLIRAVLAIGAIALSAGTVLWLRGYPLLSAVVASPDAILQQDGIADTLTLGQHVQGVLNGFVWHLIPNLLLPFRLTADPAIEYGSALQTAVSVGVLFALAGIALHSVWKTEWRLAAALLLMAPPLCRAVITISDAAFEYRAYMCGLGFAIAAGLVLMKLPVPVRVAVIGVFMAVTLSRNAVWHDPIALWEDATEKHPNHRAWNNLGFSYYVKQRYGDAEKAFLEARRLKPGLVIARVSLAAVYIDSKQFDRAKHELDMAASENPNIEQLWINYACLMLRTGQPNAAMLMADRALTINPSSWVAKRNRDDAVKLLAAMHLKS